MNNKGCILYYSKYNEYSTNLIKYLTSNGIQHLLHFICVDKRVQDPNTNKTYIVLENGERIILPENIQNVPAVLLIGENYRVLYGNNIYNYFKSHIQHNITQSTECNMEPTSFAFDTAIGSGVSSDNYSFIDINPDDMNAQGNGGMSQMHSYVGIENGNHMCTSMNAPSMNTQSVNTLPTQHVNNQPIHNQPMNSSIEQLQNMRNQDIQNIKYSRM